MDMKEGELRVYYKTGENEIESEWDKAIEEALAPLGFERWASGFDQRTKVRDLAFEQVEEEAD